MLNTSLMLLVVVAAIVLLMRAKSSKQREDVASPSHEIIDNPAYCSDKDVLECVQNELQQIEDKDLPLSEIKRFLQSSDELSHFTEKALEKGALLVCKSRQQFAANIICGWYVFSNHCWFQMTESIIKFKGKISPSPLEHVTVNYKATPIMSTTTSKKKASVGKRAVVGGVIGGAAGAAVGAASAASANSSGGVSKSSTNVSGYIHNIMLDNDKPLSQINISYKALGKNKSDFQLFLYQHDISTIDHPDYLSINITRKNVDKESAMKLADKLSEILKNLPQVE